MFLLHNPDYDSLLRLFIAVSLIKVLAYTSEARARIPVKIIFCKFLYNILCFLNTIYITLF